MPKPLDGKFYGVIHRHKDHAVEPPDSWILFVARDNALIPTLKFYKEECRRIGADQSQLVAIDELIFRVAQWRSEHPDQCKFRMCTLVNWLGEVTFGNRHRKIPKAQAACREGKG